MPVNQDKLSVCAFKTRGETSEENVFGWYDYVPNLDKPCVLFLPGDGVSLFKNANGHYQDRINEMANGQLKKLNNLLEKRSIGKEIDTCIALYAFSDEFITNKQKARNLLMKKHNRGFRYEPEKKSQTDGDIPPEYIDEIYNKFIVNRISDEKGKRLPYDQASKNIRNLIILAHCHGAYTFLKLEEKMQQQMQELGYSKEERQKLQRDLFCVSYAPYCPLGVSKSTTISFCCAKDNVVKHNNNFQTAIQGLDDFRFSYFPKEKGEVFIAPDFLFEEFNGHNFLWEISSNKEKLQELDINPLYGRINQKQKTNSQDTQNTDYSREHYIILTTMLGNAVVNGALSTLERKPLPDTKKLVSEYKELNKKDGKIKTDEAVSAILRNIFDIAEINGKKEWVRIKEKINGTMKIRKEKEHKIKLLRTLALPNIGKPKRTSLEKGILKLKLYLNKKIRG